jgi:hypothetical protein
VLQAWRYLHFGNLQQLAFQDRQMLLLALANGHDMSCPRVKASVSTTNSTALTLGWKLQVAFCLEWALQCPLDHTRT